MAQFFFHTADTLIHLMHPSANYSYLFQKLLISDSQITKFSFRKLYRFELISQITGW